MASGETKVNVVAADLPKVKANVYALHVVIGLIGGKYPRDMISRFINECVDLRQDSLLDATMMNGANYLMSTLGEDVFRKLVDHLTERVRTDDELAKGENEMAEWKDGDPVISGTVEIVDKVPDVPGEVYMPGLAAGKTETDPADKIKAMTREEHADLHSAGRKNGPGVKTAEKIRKATNAPVKKTGAARKATTGKTGGAADGK